MRPTKKQMWVACGHITMGRVQQCIMYGAVLLGQSEPFRGANGAVQASMCAIQDIRWPDKRTKFYPHHLRALKW